MKLLRTQWTWLLVLGLALGVVGCENDDDDDDNTIDPVEGPVTYTVDATDFNNWAAFNFETGATVTGDLADAGDWHVAFRRSEGKLNGGVSGNLDMQAVNLADLGHEHGNDYESLDAMPTIAQDDWFSDSFRYVFDGWYSYDFQTHTVNPTGRVFILKDASGNGHAKLVVTGITAVGPGAIGSVSLMYAYNMDGTEFVSPAQNVTIEDLDGDNHIFFSFTNGPGDVEDPANSEAWDIWFDGFDVHVNSGVSGPGDAAVFPAYADEDYDEFDEIDAAPAFAGAGYEKDSIESIFTNWYNYNGQTHELSPSYDVYLISLNDTYYKMTILSYYNMNDGTSGFINFWYDEL